MGAAGMSWAMWEQYAAGRQNDQAVKEDACAYHPVHMRGSHQLQRFAQCNQRISGYYNAANSCIPL